MRSFYRDRILNCGISTETFGERTPNSRREVIESGTLRLGDRGHYGYPNFPKKGNVGGSFDLTVYREQMIPSQSFVTKQYSPANQHLGKYGYEGFLVVNPPPGVQNTVHSVNPDSYYAEAYNRMKPTQPTFTGLNAIAELRDLPMLLKKRVFSHTVRDHADFWVAVQFGWIPLLKDVLSMVTIQRNAQKRLRQLLRDNGRPVRRNIILMNDTTSQRFTPFSGEYGLLNRGFKTSLWKSNGLSGQSLERVTTKVWASARYRFWLPPGPRDIIWTKRMLRKLYGLHPTPAVVYNAVPWSWLVDWFSNAGDMLESLDAGVADRLAADYYYVMSSHQIYRERYGWGALNGDLGPGNRVDFTVSTSCSETRKTRFRGNPFGLPSATKLSDITPMQISILGALGLSSLNPQGFSS